MRASSLLALLSFVALVSIAISMVRASLIGPKNGAYNTDVSQIESPLANYKVAGSKNRALTSSARFINLYGHQSARQNGALDSSARAIRSRDRSISHQPLVYNARSINLSGIIGSRLKRETKTVCDCCSTSSSSYNAEKPTKTESNHKILEAGTTGGVYGEDNSANIKVPETLKEAAGNIISKEDHVRTVLNADGVLSGVLPNKDAIGSRADSASNAISAIASGASSFIPTIVNHATEGGDTSQGELDTQTEDPINDSSVINSRSSKDDGSEIKTDGAVGTTAVKDIIVIDKPYDSSNPQPSDDTTQAPEINTTTESATDYPNSSATTEYIPIDNQVDYDKTVPPEPKIKKLTNPCRESIINLKALIKRLLGLTSELNGRLMIDFKVSHLTRDILARRLDRILINGQLAISAIMNERLIDLSELVRYIGLDTMRVANNVVTKKLEPNWVPFSRSLRQGYQIYRKTCKPFF